MPIDSRIPLMADAPATVDVTQTMGRGLALRQAFDQAKEDAQAKADDQVVRQTLSQSGGDLDTAIQQLYARGQAPAAMKLEVIKTQRQKNALEATKGALETQSARLGILAHMANGITDATSRDAMYKLMDPETAHYAQQMLGPPGSDYNPDKVTQTQNLLTSQLDRSKALKESADDFLSGKNDIAAARMLGAAPTPEARDAIFAGMKAHGIDPTPYQQRFPDATTAQKYFDDNQKPTAEKGGQHVEGMYQGKRTFGVFDPNTNTYNVDGKTVSARDFTPIPPASLIIHNQQGAGGAGGLTTGEGGGVEYAGTLTRILGRVPVGLARSGGAATAAINEAARQTKMLGRTPIDSVLKTSIIQGDQKALANLQKLRGAADAFETKANAQLDIVDGLSDQVWRTKSPLINRAIIAGQTEIAGDKDATLLLNAIQTASAEYAKIVMGGTASAQALSDTAAQEAKKLLNIGMSKGTLKGATKLMRTEMGLTMNGFDAAMQHITENMGGAAGAPQAQAAPVAAAPVTPALRWDPVKKTWIK